MIEKKYNFPVGWHNIHPDMSFNFQMNRFYNLTNDPTMLEEMKKISPSLHTYPDYIQAFLKLSNDALEKNQKLKAACYLRGAEFFINGDNPNKIPYRNIFISLMKDHYKIDDKQHYEIPYKTGFLSAYRFTPHAPKGTIVVFGGYDSYIEEFFPMLIEIKNNGYDIICFEGPGQGSPLENYKLTMINEWENPVKVVLDYFKLDNITLMGISLGGYLVIRAAAYEKRVKHVIADDIMTDFYNALFNSIDPVLRKKIDEMVETTNKSALNSIFEKLMNESLLINWAIKQGMHITGTTSPFDYIKTIKSFSSANISSLLTQDVLLMAGENDHYVPIYQFHDQIRALTNVHSLTARLFTKGECAQNHCQIGNIGLSLSVITNWLDNL